MPLRPALRLPRLLLRLWLYFPPWSPLLRRSTRRPLPPVGTDPKGLPWPVSAVETRERERAFPCPRKRAAPLSLWGTAFGVGRKTRHGSCCAVHDCTTATTTLKLSERHQQEARLVHVDEY